LSHSAWLIGDVDARLLAPEYIRAHREIALRGVPIANVAHHLVDAEDFLDHQHAGAAAALRGGQIGGELPVAHAQIDGAASHGNSFCASGSATLPQWPQSLQ